MNNTKIKIDFDPIKHEYFITGGGYEHEKFEPVTTILGIIDKSFALIPWAAKTTVEYVEKNLIEKDGKMFVGELELNAKNAGKIFYRAKQEHRLIKEEAGKLGTRAHAIIEKLVEYALLSLQHEDKRVVNAVESYIKWEKESKFESMYAERRVCLLKEKIAGTVDLVGKLDGKLTLVDLKTSNRLYPEYHIQVAAYAKAWEETFNEKIEKVIILRISKDAEEFEVQEVKNINKLFRVFKNCIQVWRWKNGK